MVICTSAAHAGNGTTTKAPTKATSITKTKETRGKRTLDQFGNYFNSPQYSSSLIQFSVPSPSSSISRRISTGHNNNNNHEPRAYFTTKYDTTINGNYNSNNVPSSYSNVQYTRQDPLYPGVNNNFETHETNFIGDHSPYVRHQYIEAPEPIIEIIIKESNESLPAAPLQQLPKKPKEQVQVFYVKYKKDEHNGLVIDDPVPALSPTAYHQENSEESDEDYDGEQTAYAAVTPGTPLKTTTLRTIIHPDSEKYHSNSGIQVTFNTEDKSQSAQHNYQEYIEESALRPVVVNARSALANFDVSTSQQQFQRQIQSNAIEQQPQRHRFESFQNQPQSHIRPHQFVSASLQLPMQNTPSQPFRNTPERPPFFDRQPPQSPPRFFPNQQYYESKNKSPPPSFAAVDDTNRPFFRPPQFAQQTSTKLRPQKPIPIPIHSYQQEQQQQTAFNRPPQSFGPPPQPPQSQLQLPVNNYQTFNKPNPPNSVQDFKTKPTQQQQQPLHYVFPLTQLSLPSQSPPITFASQRTPSTEQPNFNQQIQQQQQQQQQIQQQQQQQQLQQQQQQIQQQQYQQQQQQRQAQLQQQQQQTYNFNQQQQQQPSQQYPVDPEVNEFQKFVPGAELIQSVPKYEQHITQTVPLSQINQPFARPISTQLQNAPAPVAPSASESAIYNHQLIQQNQKQQYTNVQPIQQSSSPQIVLPIQQTHQQQVNSYQFDSTSKKPQIVLSQRPPIQKLIPGQSVSTLADEVFPTLENQQYWYQKNQNLPALRNATFNRPQYSDVGERSKYSVQQSISVTQASPSLGTQKMASIATSTTVRSTTTTEEPTTQKVAKKPAIELPDEVPDDLRQQLLSSGILDNADISVLDYDKIGDVPLESLPPEHLANFYGAGGGAQISSSNKILTVVRPNGDKVAVSQSRAEEKKNKGAEESASGKSSLAKKQNVELKVVRFDASNQKSVTDQYIRPDATVLPTVDLADRQYNRYLPLKVNGAQFPIPDVADLRGKKISSVVVLAPVDNLQSVGDEAVDGDGNDDARVERDIIDTKQIKFIAGDPLKQLLKKPTKDNFKKWLDKESKTDIDSQSVVLLVMR